MNARELTLAAEDAEDLEIISARLQDAVAQVKDLVYLPKSRRFAALFNRFKWEDGAAQGESARAVAACISTACCRSSRTNSSAARPMRWCRCWRSVSRRRAPDDPAGTVELVFAGGGTSVLDVECIDAGLADVSGVWAARGRPDTTKTTDMARRLDARAPDFAAQFDALLTPSARRRKMSRRPCARSSPMCARAAMRR